LLSLRIDRRCFSLVLHVAFLSQKAGRISILALLCVHSSLWPMCCLHVSSTSAVCLPYSRNCWQGLPRCLVLLFVYHVPSRARDTDEKEFAARGCSKRPSNASLLGVRRTSSSSRCENEIDALPTQFVWIFRLVT
jgi:hypothetical protein